MAAHDPAWPKPGAVAAILGLAAFGLVVLAYGVAEAKMEEPEMPKPIRRQPPLQPAVAPAPAVDPAAAAKPKPAAKAKPKVQYRYRSAVTGRYVKAVYANRHPSRTVAEKVKR